MIDKSALDATPAPTAFGKIPSEIVRSGMVSDMKRGELATFTVLCSHLDGATYSTRLAVSVIAEETGFWPSTVGRAVKVLSARGILDCQSTKGRRCNRYTIVTDPARYVRDRQERARIRAKLHRKSATANPPTKNREVNPRTKDAEVEASNPPISTVQPTDSEASADRFRPPNLPTKDAQRSEDQRIRRSAEAALATETREPSGTAAAVAAPDGEVMSALTLAGIGNPTRNRLVALLGITPELVTAEAERARARGAGPGALVENIRAAVQRRAIERARADAEERQRQEKKRAQAEAHERIEAERRETAALIDRLSDAELAELKSQALARASGFQRERWQNADPRTCYTLQVRMRAIHEAAVQRPPQ